VKRPPGRDVRARVRALPDPVARSRRLELRRLDPALSPQLLALLNDPEIARWTLRIPYPYAAVDAREFFRRGRKSARTGRSLSLHVVRRSDRALVGGIGLNDIDPEHHRAEVGYWIGRPYRGQGYAREGLRSICRLAFGRLGLDRIEAGIFPGNVASARVLRAGGFRREGVLRRSVRKEGIPTDVVLYSRLREDPLPTSRAGSGMPTR
jgi:RimJ/RimL family protein N-acetyltransferase